MRHKRASLTIVIVLLIAGVIGAWLATRPPKPPHAPLVLYCAAGIRPPVEAAAREYEKAYGTPVELQYGGSQTLLAKMELAGKGDLYLPADDSYIAQARQKDLVAEVLPLARMQAVLAVKKEGGRKIATLADLLAPRVRIAQAHPDATAIGKVVREVLQKQGQWDAVNARTVVLKGTVNDVANDVRLGTVDAGFVWDATIFQYQHLQRIDLPELAGAAVNVTAGVLKTSQQPTEAIRFARYLAARDKGQVAFKKEGYTPADGDVWEEKPKLRLMCGAMLRPAVEQTIADFEKREGVEISRIYNGCGILVAQMKTGQLPDAYFSCDTSFMNQVTDLYQPPVDISRNDMVILVPKGKHPEIKELKDLANPGLKVGLGHPVQSALGALTKNLLESAYLYDPVKANVKVESATGDTLVNQIRAGSLDAVIVYVSNAAAVREHVDVVNIDIPAAKAIQPFAICRDSPHKQVMGRLLEAIRSRESMDRFLSLGFQWRASQP